METPPGDAEGAAFVLEDGSERWIVRVGRAEQVGLDEVGCDEVLARPLVVIALDLAEVVGLEEHDEVVEHALKGHGRLIGQFRPRQRCALGVVVHDGTPVGGQRRAEARRGATVSDGAKTSR